MFLLVILALFVGSLILVPLIIVGLVLRLVLGLVLLPFRIAGFAIRLGLGVAFGLIGMLLAGTVLLIPLLPVLAVALGIWLIVRLGRRRPAAPHFVG
jgi:hypothetical protein